MRFLHHAGLGREIRLPERGRGGKRTNVEIGIAKIDVCVNVNFLTATNFLRRNAAQGSCGTDGQQREPRDQGRAALIRHMAFRRKPAKAI
jgi:hypothetical protein